MVFNPKTADNLKNQELLYQHKTGDQTAKYIDGITTKLTTVETMYITAVCLLLPEFLILYFNVPFVWRHLSPNCCYSSDGLNGTSAVAFVIKTI